MVFPNFGEGHKAITQSGGGAETADARELHHLLSAHYRHTRSSE